MSRIIKMVDEIKEYYNLNDTLLASDLGIMQQTIRGWRDGRKPSLPNYNKVKAMYEEMKQEAVDESIVQRFEALEEKVENKPYEVEVPKDIQFYLTNTPIGREVLLMNYLQEDRGSIYIRGLAFENRGKLEQYDKERILLFKLHKWAEEHNEGWTPNWNDYEEKQYYVVYDYEEKQFYVRYEHYSETFTKLPYFKSYNLAEQFIEEFGEEIKEVLC